LFQPWKTNIKIFLSPEAANEREASALSEQFAMEPIEQVGIPLGKNMN
jgi:hypothetical protein